MQIFQKTCDNKYSKYTIILVHTKLDCVILIEKQSLSLKNVDSESMLTPTGVRNVLEYIGYTSEYGQRLLRQRPSVVYDIIATDWVTCGYLK